MARVFAQEAWHKCQEQGIDNRYEMILLGAHRARQLNKGIKPMFVDEVQRGQASTVNALRDFETGLVDLSELREDLITSMQKVTQPSIQEEE